MRSSGKDGTLRGRGLLQFGNTKGIGRGGCANWYSLPWVPPEFGETKSEDGRWPPEEAMVGGRDQEEKGLNNLLMIMIYPR